MVIDIDCQDSKAIKLDERGIVANFMTNDKCAAGTGRFIEVMAQALGLSIGKGGPVTLPLSFVFLFYKFYNRLK